MKILVLDKDGVLNDKVMGLVVKWLLRECLFGRVPVKAIIKMLADYKNKNFDDFDNKMADAYYAINGMPEIYPDAAAAVKQLKRMFDKIILLTNNGISDKTKQMVTDDIKKTFGGDIDEIILQGPVASKKAVYEKYVADGHCVTVIDDSLRHLQDARAAGAGEVLAIAKKPVRGFTTFTNLADYYNFKFAQNLKELKGGRSDGRI